MYRLRDRERHRGDLRPGVLTATVGRSEQRTFHFRPGDPSSGNLRTRLLVESIRAWFFSPVGLVCAWLLALGVLIPITIAVIVTLHERIALSLLMFGMWWLAGLIVIHWWIPAARQANARTEGIAAAGWHVALTFGFTSVVAWRLIFTDGLNSPFTLSDTRPVIVAWATLALVLGALIIWARGHSISRTARYGVFAASIAAAWMSLWLVAAHGGL